MKNKYDYIIIALGNPGTKYQFTRHNIAWLAIDVFIQNHKLDFSPGNSDFYFAEKKYAGKEILIVKPTTYMNNSGLVVKHLKNKLNANNNDFIVLVDEYNFPLSKVHLKKGGSDGGHNGLSSIIYELESADFWRLRLGIDKNFGPGQLVNYVLSNFNKDEKESLDIALNKAVKSIEHIIKSGTQRAMSEINSGKLFGETKSNKTKPENKLKTDELKTELETKQKSEDKAEDKAKTKKEINYSVPQTDENETKSSPNPNTKDNLLRNLINKFSKN